MMRASGKQGQTRRAIRRIDLSVKRFAWMVLTVGLLVSGVNLHTADKNLPLDIRRMILSVVAFLWGMGKIIFLCFIAGSIGLRIFPDKLNVCVMSRLTDSRPSVRSTALVGE